MTKIFLSEFFCVYQYTDFLGGIVGRAAAAGLTVENCCSGGSITRPGAGNYNIDKVVDIEDFIMLLANIEWQTWEVSPDISYRFVPRVRKRA